MFKNSFLVNNILKVSILYFIIVLTIILTSILLFVFLKKINAKLRYEVIEYNKVKVYIQLYIFNKKIYDYKNEYTYNDVLQTIISGRKEKKRKIKKQTRNTKKGINTIIKDLSKEKIHIKIYVGNNNVIINVYLVTLISSIVSILLAKNIRLENKNNINYKLIPVYNQNYIIIDANMNTRIITILKIFVRVKLMKKRGGKHGKSSNRKLNVNSND